MTGRADRSGPAPHSEDSRAPDGPTDLEKPTLRHVLRRTAREFSADECTDLAAALTYYAVLALFPAFIALVSLVGLVGQGPQTVDTVLGVLRDTAGASVADTLEPVLTSLAQGTGAGLALVLGLAGALWSASGYVGAFGRALNRVYQVDEGRPFWKLRPANLLLTAVLAVGIGAVTVPATTTSPESGVTRVAAAARAPAAVAASWPSAPAAPAAPADPQLSGAGSTPPAPQSKNQHVIRRRSATNRSRSFFE